MDAREYLARKGVNLDKEEERPNTLEELAWSRARRAGQDRPRSGTPHDWEDWDRYHETLAEDADKLEQKIDVQAHLHYQGKDEAKSQGEGRAPLVPPKSSR